ncbi:MAG: dienelactone hydrolase [Burkholderiales bacterium]|nr:MAG: dienelactone hydrolase [Burkholderiales bacterium]
MKLISTLIASLATSIALGLPAHAQVGMSNIQAGSIPVTLIYPTTATASPVSFGAFVLNVAPDAQPLPQMHRLVVLSHGSGGSATSDHGLASALARAGFIVAQPLHAGDNFRDASKAGPEAFRSRPAEVSQVIDALAKHPQWSPKLALDQVGVHGMSAGGVTGLALAGGQWRTLNLVQHCNRVQEADAGFCYQGARSGAGKQERAASFERAKNVPEAFLPSEIKTLHGGLTPSAGKPDVRPDTRIAAVTLSVPVAAIFSAERLERIRIQVGVVSAKNDQVLVPRFHSEHVLAHCTSCQRLADLPAEHFDLLSPWPESVAREVAATQVRGGLPTPGFDAKLRDAAFAQIVQFHLKHLSPAAPAKP